MFFSLDDYKFLKWCIGKTLYSVGGEQRTKVRLLYDRLDALIKYLEVHAIKTTMPEDSIPTELRDHLD